MDLKDALEKYLHCKLDGGAMEPEICLEWDMAAAGVSTWGLEKMSEENAKAFFNPISPTMTQLRIHARTCLRKEKARLSLRQDDVQKSKDAIGQLTQWVDRLSGKPVMLQYGKAAAIYRPDMHASEDLNDILQEAWDKQGNPGLNGWVFMSETDAKAFFDPEGPTFAAIRQKIKDDAKNDIENRYNKRTRMLEELYGVEQGPEAKPE